MTPHERTTQSPRTEIASLLRAGLTSGAADQRAPELTADQWSALVDPACIEGLAGLILKASSSLDLHPPKDVAERLRAAAAQVAACNLHIASRFTPIVRNLTAAGIPVMALKGIVLSNTVYGRCDLRPMCDVDLLIPPKHASNADRVFQESNCRPGTSLVRPDFYPRFHYEREYRSVEPQPVKFDVHVRPFRPALYRNDEIESGLWSDATTSTVAAAHVHIPSPERMLLHLMGHAALHGARRLLWLLDIKLWTDANRNAIDWDEVLDLAQTWRLVAAVRKAARQAASHFGPVLPPEIHRRLTQLHSTWQERLVLRQAPRDVSSPVTHVLVEALTAARSSDRFTYLAAMASPGRGHLAQLYRGRHVGWQVFAHLRRMARLFYRPLRRLAGGP